MHLRTLALLVLATAARAQDPVVFPILREAKTGFMNRQGVVVIPPQFDPWAMDMVSRPLFAEGLQPLSKREKWGYINAAGATVIPFAHTAARPFSEGLAAVRVGAKWGYVDRLGKTRIAATFDEAGAFSEGIAWVMVNFKVGYIDANGTFLIEPKFESWSDELCSFSDGLAGAYVKKDAKGEGLWGFIDKTGTWAIAPVYKSISRFQDGLAAVTQNGERTGKYIDRSGKTVLGPYAAVYPFSEGLARVTLGDGRTGFIDRQGRLQFALQREVWWAEGFSDGLAKVTLRLEPARQEKVGYVDRSGKFAIPPVYDAGASFRGGLALVSTCGQSGYISSSGEAVWGIHKPTGTQAAVLAPTATLLSAGRVARIIGREGAITLETRAGTGSCDPEGRKLWSVVVSSDDVTFPFVTISLLEGGSFLTEERLGNIKAALTEFRIRFGTAASSNSFARAIGPASNPIGYSSVAGLGPGGSQILASVFSPDRRFEVQISLAQGGGRRLQTDPLEWTGRVAEQVRRELFGEE